MKPSRLTIFGVAILAAVGVRAATFSLNPSADAFVTSGAGGALANNNYGGAGALSVAAPGLSQGEFQTVLQFNLAAAKSSFDAQFGAGQWTIQSLSLQLTAAPPNNAIFNASSSGQFSMAWMQNEGWTEGSGNPAAPGATGISFSTLSNFVGGADEALGTFAFNGATSGSTAYLLASTPQFAAEVLGGAVVSLRMFAADSTVSYLSDSRSFGTASARPLLSITVVPEPGTLAFAGLMFCALGYRLRGTR